MREVGELFSLADPEYFEPPERWMPADDVDFAASVPDHDGWSRKSIGPWCVFRRTGRELPEQGWKIHVSARPDNAADVLEAVSRFCFERGLPFKFLSRRAIVRDFNLKFAPRRASGKFIAIYPCEDVLVEALEGLRHRLRGLRGPYILTDRRWREDSPVYLRYGSFTTRHTYTPSGSRVLGMVGPTGELVHDSRSVPFRLPDWVPVPNELRDVLSPPEAAAGFPVVVERALQFSNGGGVYLGRHATGRDVVLKEARAHAAVDQRGADAVDRLAREAEVIRELSSVGAVPELIDSFSFWEHNYLVLEKAAGVNLQNWVATRHPFITHAPTARDVAAYREQVEVVLSRVGAAVEEMHALGLAHRDLHPGNILVDDELGVRLLDFEMAADVDDASPPPLACPGFAPGTGTGAFRDHYALAVLRLWLLLPLAPMYALDPGKALSHADTAAAWFDLPRDALRLTLQAMRLTGPPSASGGDSAGGGPDSGGGGDGSSTSEVLLALGASLAGAASPDRADRLFPGDPDQYLNSGGPASLAHGAAGALWALRATGQAVPKGCERWLLDFPDDEVLATASPGLWDGLTGTAWYWALCGDEDAARAFTSPLFRDVDGSTDPSLFSGLAGMGLAGLAMGLLLRAEELTEVAERVARRIRDDLMPNPHIEELPAGLLRGWSGAAVFLVRWYEATREPEWLELAHRAVLRDLARCDEDERGTAQVVDGKRRLPYLGIGGLGVALGANAVLGHHNDPVLSAAVPRLVAGAQVRFMADAGLFSGRAGALVAMVALASRVDVAGWIEAHADAISLHLVRNGDELRVPGSGGVRFSADLATGSAGVLLALVASRDGGLKCLPFLGVERL